MGLVSFTCQELDVAEHGGRKKYPKAIEKRVNELYASWISWQLGWDGMRWDEMGSDWIWLYRRCEVWIVYLQFWDVIYSNPYRFGSKTQSLVELRPYKYGVFKIVEQFDSLTQFGSSFAPEFSCLVGLCWTIISSWVSQAFEGRTCCGISAGFHWFKWWH